MLGSYEVGRKMIGERRAPRELRKESFFQGQPVTFSEEAFLAQKPGAPLQAFHKKAVHLQLFKQVSALGAGPKMKNKG